MSRCDRFSQNRNGVRYSHVHVCKAGHEQISEILAFCAYLRKHPCEARQNVELKSRLAGQFAYNNIDYMRGKDGLITELAGLASGWWRSGGRPRHSAGAGNASGSNEGALRGDVLSARGTSVSARRAKVEAVIPEGESCAQRK